jgi:hypothetical protein
MTDMLTQRQLDVYTRIAAYNAIGYMPVTEEIQVGRLNKANTLFLDDKEMHTNEALFAVCQLVLTKFKGHGELVVGDDTYIITVTKQATDHE